ncbi:hypothetical protein CGZ80_09675 [Rhodopirellula sp. MGV]|nr:hypothetical protein CGZ80_09675 [Rhodopirellula sp. MGV]
MTIGILFHDPGTNWFADRKKAVDREKLAKQKNQPHNAGRIQASDFDRTARFLARKPAGVRSDN